VPFDGRCANYVHGAYTATGNVTAPTGLLMTAVLPPRYPQRTLVLHPAVVAAMVVCYAVTTLLVAWRVVLAGACEPVRPLCCRGRAWAVVLWVASQEEDLEAWIKALRAQLGVALGSGSSSSDSGATTVSRGVANEAAGPVSTRAPRDTDALPPLLAAAGLPVLRLSTIAESDGFGARLSPLRVNVRLSVSPPPAGGANEPAPARFIEPWPPVHDAVDAVAAQVERDAASSSVMCPAAASASDDGDADDMVATVVGDAPAPLLRAAPVAVPPPPPSAASLEAALVDLRMDHGGSDPGRSSPLPPWARTATAAHPFASTSPRARAR
jgi:hypothetical protein